MRENVIERKVCDYARKRGWLTLKFTSPGLNGVPDRICLRAGNILFIEFKSPGGRLSCTQRVIHHNFACHGHPVFTVCSVAEGRRLIDGLTTPAPPPVADGATY